MPDTEHVDAPDYPGEVVRRVFQCLNDHDLDRYPSFFAEDVVERSPYQLQGRDAVTAADLEIFALIPDHWRKIDKMIVDGDTVAFWLRFGGTVASTGKAFEVEICAVVKVHHAKIATWDFYSQRVPLPGAMEAG